MDKVLAVMVAFFIGFASASPATPTDLQPVLSVRVEPGTQINDIWYGDEMKLRCVVDGLDVPYSIQWQYSYDLVEWFELPCHDEVYSFVVTEETARRYYRVVVTY